MSLQQVGSALLGCGPALKSPRSEAIYDAVGRTTVLQDAHSNRHSFTYDAAGRRIATIDPRGQRVTATFDAAGRQTLRLDARANATTYNTTFTYDATGNRLVKNASEGKKRGQEPFWRFRRRKKGVRVRRREPGRGSE